MIFLKKTIALTLLASTLSISPALAKTPSDASLDRLATLSKIDDAFKDGAKIGFLSVFSANVKNNITGSGVELTQEQLTQIDKAIDKFGDKIIKDVASPSLVKNMRQEFKKISKQYFSQSEVDAMIQFYSTPLGRSIIDKQNTMTTEFSQAMMNMVENDAAYASNLNKSIEKNIADFEKEIDGIIEQQAKQ